MKHLAPTLGQKLDRLFAYCHHRDEPELSTQAVATLIGQRIGEPVSLGCVRVPNDIIAEIAERVQLGVPVSIG